MEETEISWDEKAEATATTGELLSVSLVSLTKSMV